MTLQPPPQVKPLFHTTKPSPIKTLAQENGTSRPILCHKCGAEIVFNKDHIAPSGKKIPLDPFFNRERHDIHCMYASVRDDLDSESLMLNFLSRVPRKKRVIGVVGKIK